MLIALSCNEANHPALILESLDIKNDALCFCGRIIPSCPQYDFAIEGRGAVYRATTTCCGGAFDEFRVEVLASEEIGGVLRFLLLRDGNRCSVNLESGKFCPVTFLRFDWTRIGNIELHTVGKRRDCIGVGIPGFRQLVLRELLFELNIALGRTRSRTALRCRRDLLLRDYLSRKEDNQIWLISDRPMMGGDNGEALFRYLSSNPINGVETYFVLRSDSPDYEKLSALGNVVQYGSKKHIRLQNRAAFVISSAADEFVINRFGSLRYVLKSVGGARFVFLQHGVTKDDMSGWLNRWNKNISLFVTASEREKQSITQNPMYGYSCKEVKLTGFPRHDLLLNEAKRHVAEKKILIAPTWRSNIAGKTITGKGTRAENPDFENSDYYCFYQTLINNQLLISAAEKMGFSITFLIHPAFAQESRKFTSSYVHIKDSYDYRFEFVTSSVMLTDYSSVAFDFALLGKPIVYAQCDSDAFYREHSWERGYFDYQSDGFGEIVCSLEETVDALIRYMESPTMPKLYKDRVDSFFFRPEGGSSCELVTQCIKMLD